MESNPLFYIPVPGNDKAAGGPYDLKQMARLLRTKIITKETMICREGDRVWKQFGEDAQFTVAEEMPTDSLAEEIQAPASLIPLPSSDFIIQAARTVAMVLIGAALAYILAKLDATTGICIAVACGAVATVAHVIMLGKVFQGDFMTIFLVMFVPFFDIFYFISNLDAYRPYLLAKYVGIILALAAGVGMGAPIVLNN